VSELEFVMLKPETIKQNLISKVLERIEGSGLKIVAMKMIQVTNKQAQELYKMHKGKRFYDKLVQNITRGPVIVMAVKGRDAVEKMREIAGATNPRKAELGTIRADYGTSLLRNVIHSADSIENAEREIKIFFKSDEITA